MIDRACAAAACPARDRAAVNDPITEHYVALAGVVRRAASRPSPPLPPPGGARRATIFAVVTPISAVKRRKAEYRDTGEGLGFVLPRALTETSTRVGGAREASPGRATCVLPGAARPLLPRNITPGYRIIAMRAASRRTGRGGASTIDHLI